MRFPVIGLIFAALLHAAPAGQAASLDFLFQEVGADVVVTASGAIDTTGFGPGAPTATIAGLNLGLPALIVSAPGDLDALVFTGVFATDPSPDLGVSGFRQSRSGSGGRVGFTVGVPGPVLILPLDYVSGAPISAQMTITLASFAGLGLAPGTFTFDLVGGQGVDVRIGAAVAPLPASALLLLPALGLLGFAGRRRG